MLIRSSPGPVVSVGAAAAGNSPAQTSRGGEVAQMLGVLRERDARQRAGAQPRGERGQRQRHAVIRIRGGKPQGLAGAERDVRQNDAPFRQRHPGQAAARHQPGQSHAGQEAQHPVAEIALVTEMHHRKEWPRRAAVGGSAGTRAAHAGFSAPRRTAKKSRSSVCASRSRTPPTTSGRWWQEAAANTRAPCSTPPPLGS